MSWESHLAGFITGFALSFYFKDEGPEPSSFYTDWEDEPEDDIEQEEDNGMKNSG